ncbi:hypothetical protein L1987_20843 [Smallanthus sonchifolius]|uniref:Uncharacterized protein n=1 Tax=Smallanthus sonchifolius TaxID=185202 RepID=A0ACB9IUM2_9ASTR|nr:hypothetical protein L1987_20843 [Smallanthus sonchifolius]
MKLGWNLFTGNNIRFTSWKFEDDPALGEFAYWIDTRDTSVITRLVLQTNGRIARFLWIDSKKEWNFIWPDKRISVMNTRCVGDSGAATLTSPQCVNV